jgi:hypothetical protein
MLMTVCAVQKQEGQYILPLSRLIQAVCEWYQMRCEWGNANFYLHFQK